MTNQTTTAIAEYSPTEAGLAELRTKYGDASRYDVTKAEGMNAAKEARRELRTVRTDLEKKRVEIKAPALERCKLIDSEAKRITAEIEKLEGPIDAKIKAEEDRKEREKEAVEAAKRALLEAAQRQQNELRNFVVQAVGHGTEEVAKLINVVRGYAIPENEHKVEVLTVQEQTLKQLDGMYQRCKAQDAESRKLAEERAELERLRAKAAEEKAAADKAAQLERDKIEAERQKAEKERQALEAKAAAERKAADDAAAKARAEQDRLAAVAREKEEAKIRAERAKLDAERDAAAALERRKQEEAEAKARAEREAAEAKARVEEAERVRKLGARALLEQFVSTYGAMPDFAEPAAYLREWLGAHKADATVAKAAKAKTKGAA